MKTDKQPYTYERTYTYREPNETADRHIIHIRRNKDNALFNIMHKTETGLTYIMESDEDPVPKNKNEEIKILTIAKKYIKQRKRTI